MGKSSLMARILSHAKQADYQTASLNFQLIDDDCLKNLDQFLLWFCASISDELELPALMEDYWKGILGSKKNCTNYFQKYLLSKREVPLALGLDEVDQVFRYPEIATGFLGLLRAWHEKGPNDPVWEKLRLVIVHSKEVDFPLDINQSPFNVGLEVKLPEFTPSQVEDLAKRHGLHWSVEEKEGLIEMCGGHPYLIRVALYEIARERMTWQDFLSVAPTDEGIYQGHLRRHLWNLKRNESLLMAYKQVVATDHPVQIGSSEGFKLKSMGLVKFQGNKVMPLCELYRRYFRNRLGVS
ncbi:MAG: AAA-like domain-containing protein [Crocosphaera sp.]